VTDQTLQRSDLISRREAARRLIAALAFPLALDTASSAESKQVFKTAIGLNGFQSGSRKYKKNYPIWEVLDFAARHGFEGVELVSDWPSGGYPAAAEKERVNALRQLYDRYGLRIFSIQLGADGAFDPTDEGRQQWLKQFHDRIQLAKQLGGDCVGMWPGGGLRGQTIDEAIERLAGTFREAGKIAGDAGLLACFEIEPVFVFNKAEALLEDCDIRGKSNAVIEDNFFGDGSGMPDIRPWVIMAGFNYSFKRNYVAPAGPTMELIRLDGANGTINSLLFENNYYQGFRSRDSHGTAGNKRFPEFVRESGNRHTSRAVHRPLRATNNSLVS
jgi:hypothetical protein